MPSPMTTETSTPMYSKTPILSRYMLSNRRKVLHEAHQMIQKIQCLKAVALH